MVKLKFSRRKIILAVAMLPFLLLSAQAFGQSSRLSGTVTDSSQAVLPGATVKATNTATGVGTSITTNNAGVYNMALAPGTYTVSANMPGFQTATRTDVEVGVAATLRLNFELEVSGVATQIEVSTSAADLLLESSSSTGTVMNNQVAKELPLLGNDMMQLINVMGGVVKPENTVFGNSNQTFAGVLGNDINLMRDGISVNDVRFSSGIVSPGRINPEMVGEFKLVLTPVDAEMGRGAGQVQILTKSGGNEYHGSGVWSILNTALDANEWDANRTGDVADYKNVNNYTISVGGPIIKNRTFFFVTWDQNIVRKRNSSAIKMLTPCARKGIYRYWPGWQPGNVDAEESTSGVPITPSVDSSGMPVAPSTNPDGSAYTDSLQWISVLGQLTPEAAAQVGADPYNCSQYTFGLGNTGIVPGSNWDPYRTDYDTSGFTDRFSAIMPLPNYYRSGDGLNTAALRRTIATNGSDSVYGTGIDAGRHSITLKIDHNLNEAHRLTGTYSYERSLQDKRGSTTNWPDPYGFSGANDRKPQTFTTSLTSTLRPTLLNEVRFGLSYSDSHNLAPLDNPVTGQGLEDLLQMLSPTDDYPQWPGLPQIIYPGVGDSRFQPGGSHPVSDLNVVPSSWGSSDKRWTLSDTVTWTKGSHSIKFGGDFRYTQGRSDMNGWGQFGANSPNWHPVVFGGPALNAPPSGLGSVAGLVGSDNGADSTGSIGAAYDLMDYMAGSISVIRQFYFVNDTSATVWSDPSTPEGQTRYLKMNQKEFSFFFKDDWKVNSDLTLNLGIRWEYYGVPWMLNGMTAGVIGGPLNLFGGSPGGFDEWLQGAPSSFNPDNLTELEFIGPGSANPDRSLYNPDYNNFGPAVGFAWQLPWFGKGKTTLRGGYQMSYTTISRLDPNGGVMNAAGSVPGLLYPHEYFGDATNYPYMDMSMLADLVPTSRFHDGSILPLATRPITDGTQSITVYEPNIRTPYVQSLTLGLTRQIGSSLTIDVRYIGTLSRKQTRSININTVNWLNNGLKEALDVARAGGESELLDTLMPPNSFWYSFLGGPSGADQLRSHYLTSGPLATGDYEEIATVLGTTNGLGPPFGPAVASGVEGNLLRRSGLGENFIFTNRQFDAANIVGNHNHTNYHSLQFQTTLRPMHGLNFQSTYTWSRNLGVTGTASNPLNRAFDYDLSPQHRSHTWTTYGTYNLPLGRNGYLFRDSPKWAQMIAEGWQLSWISSVTSGIPASVSTVASMFGGSAVDFVGPPGSFDSKGGEVTWENGSRSGLYYGDMYVHVDDPQCDSIAAGLQDRCREDLHALALASDPSVIVFQKAQPGSIGNFQVNRLTGPGRWSLDMAISKNIEFMEGKSINFRVDVNNIFNHPTPSGGAPQTYNDRDYSYGNPDFNLNSSDPFGYISHKGGHRVFSAKMRITF